MPKLINYENSLGFAKACTALTPVYDFQYKDKEGTTHTYYEVCFLSTYGLLNCRIPERHVDYVSEKLCNGAVHNINYDKRYHNRLICLDGVNLDISK